MSKVTDSRTYSLDSKAFGDAFVAAGKAIRLREKSRTDTMISMGEGFSLFSFRWPASITALLKPAGAQTTVDYAVSNFGFGPVQAGHCKKILEGVTSALAGKQA